ncbi:hypothetical protein IKE82_01725 [Candidatus Saccharibacteria bacterium]|nr:hypothetical protein [Candidatus Saccharibacteria bacterium]
MKRFKKGAASFYVVAFSTLILLVVVAGFTALVVAQITRSSNDDLSQSAYDSALAGIEDAKLAYYNYRNCIAQGAIAKEGDINGEITCGEIVHLVENEEEDCDLVAKILGRTISDNGVSVNEISSNAAAGNNQGKNSMQQFYTCTKLQTSLKDYRTSLSQSNPMKAVNVKIDNMGDESITVDDIESVKISWGSEISNSDVKISNFVNNNVEYPKVDSNNPAAMPPTIGFALVQAGSEFKVDDFEKSVGAETNRGMIYMTPIDTTGIQTVGKKDNYSGVNGFDKDTGVNTINSSALLKSNDKTKQNLPYGVSCPNVGGVGGEFACSVQIDLPRPIGGERGEENMLVAVLLPYGAATDVALEFFCADGESCGKEKVFCSESDIAECGGKTDEVIETPTKQINLKGMQIAIDSTGRANDLFRRVETRLEDTGDFALMTMGPLELSGSKDGDTGESESLVKNWPVICEYLFEPTNGLSNNRNICDQ